MASAMREPAPDYDLRDPDFLEAMGRLSKRQRQVAEWVASGDKKTRQQLADALEISKKTLARHLQEAVLKCYRTRN